MNIITKEDLELLKLKYLTVGQLKQKLESYNDDALVMVQRVEDKYFKNNNWKVYPKIGEFLEYPEQYHPAWCIVKYTDEDNLFLDLHY